MMKTKRVDTLHVFLAADLVALFGIVLLSFYLFTQEHSRIKQLEQFERDMLTHNEDVPPGPAEAVVSRIPMPPALTK